MDMSIDRSLTAVLIEALYPQQLKDQYQKADRERQQQHKPGPAEQRNKADMDKEQGRQHRDIQQYQHGLLFFIGFKIGHL